MLAQRILIYGVTGSGKTTAAKQISARLGLEAVLVDDICFLPGWQEVPIEEQRAAIEKAVANESWVLDSAYGKWLDIVLPRAELIVGLDYPLWITLPRLWIRTARRVITGEPCCNGNRETLRKTFSHDSIILWQFRSFRSKHTRLMRFAKERPEGSVLVFTRPSQLEAWINQLPGAE